MDQHASVKQTLAIDAKCSGQIADNAALMGEHLNRMLSIDELAENIGVSRRHLERRLFKQYLGCFRRRGATICACNTRARDPQGGYA